LINIYELTYDTLASLGYPVKEQGTLGKELPETFVTYQLIDSPPTGHADNAPTGISYRMQITLYSTSPTIKQGADAAIKAVMLPAKFMRVSGRDLPYSSATGHYAFTSDYRFYDMEE
jgi:hypothetical protein